MRERGWEAAALTWSDEIAGETRLLPHEHLRRYHRPGYAFPARVVLAVWPAGNVGTDGFHVVLTTANPSLRMRIEDLLD